MKVNLISFQDKAVKDLRVDIADALDNYRRRKKTQVVSLQAPTGAGKTIICSWADRGYLLRINACRWDYV